MEVHRCRFVSYSPSAIQCLAFNPSGTKIAVARADSNIEIWNIENDYLIEQIIYGSTDTTVESVFWTTKNRLFSAGLHGKITEWDPTTGLSQSICDSYGGAVWCISINSSGTLLAAGCEDGCCRIYDIDHGGLEYVRTLEKMEGRVLSVAWHQNQTTVVGGSSESQIFKYDAISNRTLLRMTLNTVNDLPTLVWNLAILSDFTIVSGDSTGHTEFWDGMHGTLTQSFQTHDADVVALVTSQDETCVYISGVDNKVVELKYTETSEDENKWIKESSVRAHTHDVRALALHDHTLISGGVDTNIIVYNCHNLKKMKWRRIPPFPHQSNIFLATAAHLVMYQSPQSLKLWMLGKSDGKNFSSSAHGKQALIATNPRLMLEFVPKSGKNIVGCAISSNGKFICYSDSTCTKIFHGQLSNKNDSFGLKKISKHGLQSIPATRLCFSPDGSRLFASTTSKGKVYVLNMETLEIESTFKRTPDHNAKKTKLITQLDGEERMAEVVVSHMTVSKDNSLLGVCYSNNDVELFDVATSKTLGKIPKLETRVTAMTFQPNNNNHLFVTCVCNRVFAFDPKKLSLTKWSQENSENFPVKFLQKNAKTVHVTFAGTDANHLYIQDHTCFYKLDLTKTLKDCQEDNVTAFPKMAIKNPKSKSNQNSNSNSNLNSAQDSNSSSSHSRNLDNVAIKAINKYQPLLFLDFIDSSSCVVVERPWLDVMSEFPAPLLRTRYGM